MLDRAELIVLAADEDVDCDLCTFLCSALKMV